LPIIVANPEACPRYLGRVIQAVNPQAATPLWMMERLRRSGQRSLGILVDVTNYVLLELGQPLHAFDAAKLSGNIQVRYARVGESLALLNGQHIELTAETLVIADQQKPLALAGIMGGSESAVSETTTDIFLECAFFNPIIMAGKARQYGLHTDSSHRFERGVDFELQHRAIERATQLIVEIAGGLVAEINEFVDQKHLPKISPIQLRHSRINQVLGIEIADNIVIDILQNLGMQVLSESNIWTIIPPSARFDIKIEADLIEEIARIYGYNQLPQQLTITPNQLAQVQETQLTLDRIKDLLVDRGYQEIVSYSFVDPNLQQQLMPDFPAVALQNPISNEMAVMRTTLWSGLLSTALHNLHRQHSRMRLFETGLRFVQQDGQLQQQKRLAGLIIGSAMPEQWAEANRPVDFFDLKADVEAIFALSGSAVEYVSANHSALHPGQSAQLLNSQGELIGWVGLLHPTLERNLGFHQSVFLFELDQATLLTKPLPHFQPLSKFPSVRRDLAIIVEDKITANAIINSIYQSAEANLQQAFIFDVYQGKGITEGYKSIALALILQNNEQTLTDLQIDAIVTNFLNTLTRDTGAKLRD
jgi:phenylalanyl-tRNA synthetase beta chain